MNGWLKLHRQIIDSEVFANADLLRLWILLLARASVQRRFAAIPSGRGFTTVELKPGDAITGKKETGKLLGWPPSTFYDRLKRLEALDMIDIDPDTNGSIVSIRNWLVFQGSEDLDPSTIRPQSPTPSESRYDTGNSLTESHPNKRAPTPKSDHDPSTIRTHSVYDPDLIENEKKEKKEEKGKADKSVSPSEDPLMEEILLKWNSTFEQSCRLTDNRKKSLRTRLKDQEWREHWREAIDRASQSAFLRGQNDKGWKADFEWFLKPDSLVRILEGRYDGPGGAKRSNDCEYQDASVIMAKRRAEASHG